MKYIITAISEDMDILATETEYSAFMAELVADDFATIYPDCEVRIESESDSDCWYRSIADVMRELGLKESDFSY